MASSHTSLSVKHFFTAFFVLLLAVGLFGALYSVQHPTNTQSDAASCTTKPSWVSLGSDDEDFSVTYHLKLINNCGSNKDFLLDVVNEPNEQDSRYSPWYWKFAAEANYRTPHRKDNVDSSGASVNLRIVRPYSISSGAVVKNLKPGYRYFTLKASLIGNPEIYKTIQLIYNVENN